jgi:hypothetical protein
MCSCENNSGWGSQVAVAYISLMNWEIWFDILVKIIPPGRATLKMGMGAIS